MNEEAQNVAWRGFVAVQFTFLYISETPRGVASFFPPRHRLLSRWDVGCWLGKSLIYNDLAKAALLLRATRYMRWKSLLNIPTLTSAHSTENLQLIDDSNDFINQYWTNSLNVTSIKFKCTAVLRCHVGEGEGEMFPMVNSSFKSLILMNTDFVPGYMHNTCLKRCKRIENNGMYKSK